MKILIADITDIKKNTIKTTFNKDNNWKAFNASAAVKCKSSLIFFSFSRLPIFIVKIRQIKKVSLKGFLFKTIRTFLQVGFCEGILKF